jgi:hypothetical protein
MDSIVFEIFLFDNLGGLVDISSLSAVQKPFVCSKINNANYHLILNS